MKKPTLLFNCRNKLDAYFLKNVIQKIATIPVWIIRKKKQILLFVENSNVSKAKIILENQLSILPSKFKNRTSNKEELYTIKPIKKWFYRLEEIFVNVLNKKNGYPYNPRLLPLRVFHQNTPFKHYKN